MKMTPEQFRNEHLYETTMMHLKGMLDQGLITAEEYRAFETKFREKYKPISDGLFARSTCYVFKTERK